MQLVIHGRDEERASTVARLRERRLVTVVGPGGIGKTALAHVAAEDVASDFALGAIVVDLTRVDRPDGVQEAIAGQLGYADFASLLDSPSDQPALVLVDNCEHVLDAAASAIDRMLEACRMPTVLATSRVPLDLPDESIVSLGPLATPDAESVELDTPAMRLLLERMRDHGIEPDTIDAIDPVLLAEVCRRLDGVPLALELAAARLRVVSPAELLRELDERPHALARRRYRGQTSHRSVAEVVGWSTDLLEPRVRTVFEHLGVFAGPFTAGMAESVAAGADNSDNDDNADGVPVADALAELVDASLVVADASGPTARYRLLHPVRAVAIEMLRSRGRLDAVWSRLADQVVAAAVDVIAGTTSQWNAGALDELMAQYDNIAAALRWLIDHDESPDRAHTLVAVLWGLVHQAHTAEIATLGEAVLRRWDAPDAPLWPDAVATVVTCRSLTQRYDEAIELAESALDAASRSHYAPATLRRALAQTYRTQRDPVRSVAMFREGADVAASAGTHGLALELRVDVGLVEAELGHHDEALTVLDATLTEARRRGAAVNEAWALAGRAHVLLYTDPAAAVAAAGEALAMAERIDYPAGRSCSLRVLARAQLALGRIAEAAATTDRLLDELLTRGGLNDLRMVLDVAAAITVAVDDAAWPDLAATALALPITTVMVPTDPDLPTADGSVLSTRDAYVLARAALRRITAEGPARPTSPVLTPQGSQHYEPSVVDDGEVMTLRWHGEAVTVKKSKGLSDLVHLLAHPDRDVSCLDLMDAGVVASAAETEALDATARRQYEDRIRELHADIEQAEQDHDLGTAERLQAEMDLLVDELTSALGLGARSRTSAPPAERARSAVTQRLRATIKRIGEHHPGLGEHLASSITTGQFCSYRPADGTTWTVG